MSRFSNLLRETVGSGAKKKAKMKWWVRVKWEQNEDLTQCRRGQDWNPAADEWSLSGLMNMLEAYRKWSCKILHYRFSTMVVWLIRLHFLTENACARNDMIWFPSYSRTEGKKKLTLETLKPESIGHRCRCQLEKKENKMWARKDRKKEKATEKVEAMSKETHVKNGTKNKCKIIKY